ncbi:MAG: hypothetical protein ACP5KK_00665 [Candidatus Nanoarchaeia archaeon]
MEGEKGANLEDLRKEITELSNILKNLSEQQKTYHKEKKDIDAKLSELIETAKKLKKEKQELTSEIKNKKALRAKLNREVAEAFRQTAKQKSKVDPKKLSRQIEAMQYAIEVEGLPFEKEKLYMDRIKQLKQKLAELEAASQSNAEYQQKKAKADEVHAAILALVSQNNTVFTKLTQLAQEIKSLKTKRKAVQAKIKEIKLKIDENTAHLSQTLSTWLSATEKEKETKAPEVSTEQILEQFKNTKKLTKEDLFKLQRALLKNSKA